MHQSVVGNSPKNCYINYSRQLFQEMNETKQKHYKQTFVIQQGKTKANMPATHGAECNLKAPNLLFVFS